MAHTRALLPMNGLRRLKMSLRAISMSSSKEAWFNQYVLDTMARLVVEPEARGCHPSPSKNSEKN